MDMPLIDWCRSEIASLRAAGTYKTERVLETPTGARIRVDGRDVLMLTSNNYLGFANHPRIVEAARAAVSRWGSGLGSVRFICGTQRLHKELEEAISRFFGTDDAILYMSCWNANEGLFQPLLHEEDAVLTDALNHASIIDGIRLCKAKRFIVPHGDLAAFETALKDAQACRRRLLITDGVFSMEGEVGPLRELADLCDRYATTLVVDDSHATGVLGATGRGTAEHLRVRDRIPIHTSTLGKAMGSAAGGFITGPAPVIDLLRQRSRTTLFSNSLPPAVAAASLEAFRMLMEDPSPVRTLQKNALTFRTKMKAAGFTIPEGIHPIVPVIVGDTAKALAMSDALFRRGVYVSGFGFPVVPQGHARLRCQVSAVHTDADLDEAVAAFTAVGKEFGAI
ncbi:MAG TPA: glycine C-acetyltransferase [Thermoanaerobaculia bacterium]|nr:glycine C-acetyltransferase [Thermoanaerobaculia bacterium]HQR67335.1 glycine C-acetyltransferase [Thermoanaerobaculia bacterium]